MDKFIETIQTVGAFVVTTLGMYSIAGAFFAILFSMVCGLALLATIQEIIER